MLIRVDDILDLPAFRLRRRLPGQGLTSVISTLPRVLEGSDCTGAILMLDQLRAFRQSEALALTEAILATGGRGISAIVADGAVAAALTRAGLGQFAQIVSTVDGLCDQPPNGSLSHHAAVMFCDRRVPFLGPMAQLDPHDLADPTGSTPWLDTLRTLAQTGITQVQIVIRPDQECYVPALRRLCPRGVHLRFVLAEHGPLQAVSRISDNGLGHAGPTVLIDGWADASPRCLTALALRHDPDRLTHLQSGGKDQDARGISIVSPGMVGAICYDNTPWHLGVQLARHRNLIAVPDINFAPLDRGSLTGACAVLTRQVSGQSQVHGTARVSRRANVNQGCWIGANCRIDADAHLENVVLLPGTQVAAGTWLSDMVVGPDWAVDLKYAWATPLNLSAADGCKPIAQVAQQLGKIA